MSTLSGQGGDPLIVFRVDASVEIGTGHVMRCLALATQLVSRGARPMFLCRSLPAGLASLITARGIHFEMLTGSNQSVILGGEPSTSPAREVSWQEDSQLCQSILGDTSVAWLIVDHYALDARWESVMRRVANRVMVIDDLADRAHDCDLILDQNFYEDAATRYKGLIPDSCVGLLGPQFALLRSEFSQARDIVRERSGKIQRLLVFFGGADSTNEISKVLEAIYRLEANELFVDVIAGPVNPWFEDVARQCASLPNAQCVRQVEDMAARMLAADLMIGAGGSTTWERLCLGVPSIVITVADNQMETSKLLAREGFQYLVGSAIDVTVSDVEAALRTALKDQSRNARMSEMGRALVDGNGVTRICEYLLS